MKLGKKTKRPTRKDFSEEDAALEEEVEVLTRRQPARLPAPVKRRRSLSVPDEESPDPNEEGDRVSHGTDEHGVRLLPGVSKTTLRRLNTMFGQRSDAIIDLLETSDTDGAAVLITRTLIQTLVDVMPVVERGVRKSKGTRGVMPLNQVISQIRELLHDVQAYKDRDMLGQSLVDKFLRPAFLDIAMNMSNLMVELDASARSKMSPKDYDKYHDQAENLKSSLADFMRRQYEELAKSIKSSL